MTYLESLPADAGLLSIFQAYPGPAGPLLDLHEEIMRADSPLPPAQREMIAAFVSATNDCTYCHGAHSATAEAFGMDPGVLTAIVTDLDTAPIGDDMKVLLRYLGKLTRTPAKMTPGDAKAVYAAGWDERALHDAVLVCALFNFMNRMVDGLGVEAKPEYVKMSGERLRNIGYKGLATMLND